MDLTLLAGKTVVLPTEVAHHVLHVLRMQTGQTLVLFTGDGSEYQCDISHVKRSEVTVLVTDILEEDRESPLITRLGIAVLQRSAMDAALTRATELGASEITPIITENCSTTRLRPEHWRHILQSSCEQSGRNQVPTLWDERTLAHWLSHTTSDLRLVANPVTQKSISNIEENVASVSILIGPEGGLTATEINQAEAAGFQSVTLGKRILRAETVPAAILAIVQHLWGDL